MKMRKAMRRAPHTLFPDPERMRMNSPLAKFKTRLVLHRMPKETLRCVYDTFNYWNWPTGALGTAPANWENLPNYRKPWMPENIVTREDYIRPYMCVLYDLGIKANDLGISAND